MGEETKMKDAEILSLQTRILERVASLETHVKDQNGWVKALSDKISSVELRLWGILIGEIVLIVSVIITLIK